MAQLFNVPPTRFAGSVSRPSVVAEVQNALARLGATHVVEHDATLPSERLELVHEATREALTLGEPRLLTALAPVVIDHIDEVGLFRLERELGSAGLVRRLPWFAANVEGPDDLLDATIRSRRTIDELREEASPISQRWGVITALRPADFTAAIEDAHAGDR